MSETNLQLFPGVFRSTQGGANPDFFLHSSGRVGIGNDAPDDKPSWSSDNADRNKLNVTGHTHIDGNLNVTGHLYGDGSTLSGVAAVVGGYWDLDQSNNNIKYEAGNVGVGGVAGTEALTVYGDLNLKSGGQLKLNGVDAVFSNWTSHTDGIYRTTNVGIGGVPSVTHKLKVHGTVEASSFSGIQASDVPTLDTSKISGLANSATITASSSRGNSTIVQRHSSGYIFANYFNTAPNDVDSGVTKVCVETGNDGYIRHGTAAAINAFLGIGANSLTGGGFINISGYQNRVPYGNNKEFWKVDLANGYFEHGEQGFTDDDSGGPNLPIGIASYYSIHSKAQLFVTSDKRTKTNVRSMDTDVCLEHVNNLNPVSFNKISPNGNFTPQIGFIAQEVENNLPTSVMTNVATLPNILLYGTLSNRVYIDVVEDDGEKHEAIKFDLTVKNGNLNHLTDRETIRIGIEGKNCDFLYDKSICGDIQNNGTSLSVCLPKHKEKEIPDKDIFDDVWIEGTEVNDVKSLDYNQIFCVLMGAVKEIDKQRKQDKIGFESQLSQLMSRIEALEGS